MGAAPMTSYAAPMTNFAAPMANYAPSTLPYGYGNSWAQPAYSQPFYGANTWGNNWAQPAYAQPVRAAAPLYTPTTVAAPVAAPLYTSDAPVATTQPARMAAPV